MQYKNTTVWTKELVLEAMTCQAAKQALLSRIILTVAAVLFAYAAYLFYSANALVAAGFCILAAGLTAIYTLMYPEIAAKRSYKKQEKIMGENCTSTFSAEEFTSENEFATMKRPYSHIEGILESKNACILKAGMGVLILDKNTFTDAEGNPVPYETARDFLREKLGK